jgi:UDP-N-acetylmuramoylalanine--D-glutamate ligase
MQNWTGKKVTVVGGLGIEGMDLTRYFASHGAVVTVSDRRSADSVTDRLKALEAITLSGSSEPAPPLTLRLGANSAGDIDGADLVCVSQGVPLTNPAVAAAWQRGIPVTSMTKLFLETYPGPVAGVTGSSGKTTTTSLVDAIFRVAGRDHVLGGNIGLGLMTLLDEARADCWAVLEVSHTQLVLTDRSPQVAALLRVTPNHLDQFTWHEYVALKAKIFEFQTSDDIAVFNADDPVSRELMPRAKGRRFQFSVEADPGADGAFLRDGCIYWRLDGVTRPAVGVEQIPLRGFHNVANVASATAIAAACAIEPEAVAMAVRNFKAPAHRLELVGKHAGVAYYNDSIATSPERTVAGLLAFEEPVVLLLGGRDKHLPLDEMVRLIGRRCRAVVCFGESGPVLAEAVQSTGVVLDRVETLQEAVEAASRRSQDGDVVLLSPACTSFDAYENFEQRGAEFRRLVRLLK